MIGQFTVTKRARHKDGFYRLKNFCDRPEILAQSEHERVTQWARRHADGSHLVPPMSVYKFFFALDFAYALGYHRI